MQEGTLGGEARATRYEVRSASVRTRVKDLVTWADPRTIPLEKLTSMALESDRRALTNRVGRGHVCRAWKRAA